MRREHGWLCSGLLPRRAGFESLAAYDHGMAKLLYEAKRHWCLEEMVEFHGVYIGSIAQCSCGQYHRLTDSQIDGPWWKPITPQEAEPFLKIKK